MISVTFLSGCDYNRTLPAFRWDLILSIYKKLTYYSFGPFGIKMKYKECNILLVVETWTQVQRLAGSVPCQLGHPYVGERTQTCTRRVAFFFMITVVLLDSKPKFKSKRYCSVSIIYLQTKILTTGRRRREREIKEDFMGSLTLTLYT